MYFSTQELEARGWTKGLIKKFMPEPSDIKYFRYGCQHFYGIYRVQEIEASSEFKHLQAKALHRRDAGRASAEKRKADYLDYLKNRMPVRVRELPLDEVTDDAIRSYNAYKGWKSQFVDDYYQSASLNSGQGFLERITVNYIRHHLTRYDDLLESQYGKLGKQEALEIIQIRIFQAIADAYPTLRDECDRQLVRRGLLPSLPPKGCQLSLF